ncbi:ring-cleaving dioxygenase [Pelagibacterium montanilacus]|uniref:ring-cleaving dioxygenase n=1 Tax=Pelagibacterium montanilacus TaxID=2185280 RepID=UPI000F8DFDA7|nr:ring-cleaving dioxygenase [Pelagibacterium montanilacus]
MLDSIRGLHHVTAMARDPNLNNRFFSKALGLRRVKITVNFDEPSVYHLYYGDAQGTPGSVMTHFPFPHIVKGRPGTGEVGETAFSVPEGSLGYWAGRLPDHGADAVMAEERFGEKRLRFAGPEGDRLALVETSGDTRAPWLGAGVPEDAAIRGFHSVTLRLRDGAATEDVLKFMGYTHRQSANGITRYGVANGNGADVVDIQVLPNMPRAEQGAGSVHHVAFSVANRAEQAKVRDALAEAGHHVTPSIDRDYFYAIYFRTPGGVLFEVATDEPGFARDEDEAELGTALKLPTQHEHLRDRLVDYLPEIKED